MVIPGKKTLIIGLLLAVAILLGAGYQVGKRTAMAGYNPVLTSGGDLPGGEGIGAGGFGETGADDGTGLGPEDEQIPGTEEPTVTVYVAGAVEQPGVYSFPEGARIVEGIEKAVPAADAELTYINLAERMSDQQQILVPKKGQVLPGGGLSSNGTGSAAAGSGTVGSAGGKININTAGASVLDRLPGIGPVTAQKIIEYRQANGPFQDPAELTKVTGLGEKKYAQLKDRVTVR